MTIEEAYNEFRELLDKYFHGVIRSTGYVGSEFTAELPNENLAFINTPYFYKEDLKFVHWTSIDNLLSILNNREFRLYNLHNSKDENEFNFAAKELEMGPNEINFAKKYYYIFSFCKKDDLSNQYLWEEYGKNASGVAIEFSIENDPRMWDNYMISNVYYEIPKNFKPFITELSELKKHGIGFSGYNIGKFIGFHKMNDFCNEREVRIATYFPYKNTEEYLKFAKTEFRIDNDPRRNRITNYISLPLWVDNNSGYVNSDIAELDRKSSYDESYFLNKPKLKITDIHFGQNCGIDNQELSIYTNELTYIIQENLGYRVQLALNKHSL